ncbi:MAG: histidine phosphatase family protein [Desulfobacteraceae bacterium]|nr:histidine phosphatase family protein [Desulfobacteraceae bacterium]
MSTVSNANARFKKMTRIHLIRHGDVHNPEKILYGRLPGFRLSQNGRRQARATARYLCKKPIRTIFSSPMLRARQTAAYLLQHHNGLKLKITDLLNEVLTPYQGQPGKVIDARAGDVFTHNEKSDNYEQPGDILQRVHKFIHIIQKHYQGEEIAAVTHGDIIVFTVLWSLGAELIPANKNRLIQAGYAVSYPATASVTSLIFEKSATGIPSQIKYIGS